MVKSPRENATTEETSPALPEWAGVDETMGKPLDSEVATRPSAAELASAPPEIQSLVQWLAVKAEGTDEDTWASLAGVIRQMMESDNPDDVLREQAPIHGKEFLNKPFLVTGFDVREGDFEEGAPFYVVLHAQVGSPPESRVITCGGWSVLAQMMRLDQLGEWPQMMILEGIRTRKGYTTLKLRRPV